MYHFTCNSLFLFESHYRILLNPHCNYKLRYDLPKFGSIININIIHINYKVLKINQSILYHYDIKSISFEL